MGMQYYIEPPFRQSAQSVMRMTYSLLQSDGTALETATGAAFALEFADESGNTFDASSGVSAPSSSTIQVEVTASDWSGSGLQTGETITGWLYYTPSGGEQEAVAQYVGFDLVAG